MMPKVYIVGRDPLITTMYLKRGWKVVSSTAEANLLQFTGGDDIDPSYYSQEKHPFTSSNPVRDAYEANIFSQERHLPMVGICRGGQFLNVMCGGDMWQHVNGHMAVHKAEIVETGEHIDVSSDHHQMMDPANHALILMIAEKSTWKEKGGRKRVGDEPYDVEACLYTAEQCLCFQSHPEYFPLEHESQELYFEWIERYLGVV